MNYECQHYFYRYVVLIKIVKATNTIIFLEIYFMYSYLNNYDYQVCHLAPLICIQNVTEIFFMSEYFHMQIHTALCLCSTYAAIS